MWEFQIRWGGTSLLKPLRRYLRYFRGTHWPSASLSRRLLAFYTWMNRVTECLYGVQCRSRGIGWLKRCSGGHQTDMSTIVSQKIYRYMYNKPRQERFIWNGAMYFTWYNHSLLCMWLSGTMARWLLVI